MSIALERNNSGGGHRIEGPGLVHRSMACVTMPYESSELCASDRRSAEVEEEEEEDRSGSLSSSSTSSIGKNSDENSEGGGRGSDEEEVQSEFKGGPLDSLDSLEEVLPIKKSISKFYCGKSKSYTSLSDAASSSIKDITKPENEYTRKRKNLLAFNNLWDRNHNSISRSRNSGISKRPSNSRSMLALAANMNCSESNSGETSNTYSSSPGCGLPPLPPHARKAINSGMSSSPPADTFSSWRSFSLSDLQGAAAAESEAATPSITGLWSNNIDK